MLSEQIEGEENNAGPEKCESEKTGTSGSREGEGGPGSRAIERCHLRRTLHDGSVSVELLVRLTGSC